MKKAERELVAEFEQLLEDQANLPYRRAELVKRLRDMGWSYGRIGKTFQVTKQRAAQWERY